MSTLQLENARRETMAQSERNRELIEEECDTEIGEARESFLQQLKQKDETILQINNKNGLLMKRSQM